MTSDVQGLVFPKSSFFLTSHWVGGKEVQWVGEGVGEVPLGGLNRWKLIVLEKRGGC